jgi:2-oxo-4-hydroxy-4-carboxy-5-ureidoimidazoline decarboxylase
MSLHLKLNAGSPVEAREKLTRCCGSSRWVEEMLARRPFRDDGAVLAAADEIAATLTREDWLEAVSHHPRIGDVESLRKKFASTVTWASSEQAGARQAAPEVLQRLADRNVAYEKRFGHIFIVCATGKSATQMLELLDKRLPGDPRTELGIAAREQMAITKLRLEKL